MEEGALGPPLNDRDIGWVQDGRPGQAEGRQGGPRVAQDLGLLHEAPQGSPAWPLNKALPWVRAEGAE